MYNHLSKKTQAVASLLFILVLSFPFLLSAQDQELKICAIRVEFVEDRDENTTGNGKFMIDTVTTDPFAIDPAPHDKPYFEDQITALANYYKYVSKNSLNINGQVYPEGDREAYQLPQQMGYYNPNTTDQEINLGLSRLFSDAITAADQADTSIHFDNFDLVVIFHAGVGKDINLGFDETPQDIPSLFINYDFLKASFGQDFEGVSVKDGKVTQGIIMPETENQQDESIAMTGIFASNVGSYLGLYDLFSPSKQRTGIGRFGLMDFGLVNLNGLVPAPLSAFSRQLLSWDETTIINSDQTAIQVSKAFDSNPQNSTLVQIPINETEYYLIENRGNPDFDLEQEYIDLAEGRDAFPTYLELLKTNHSDRIEISENGVLLSFSDYDMGLPGSGILVWHIDQSRISENADKNRINDNPDYRAVDLEEADGPQDIGELYGLLDAGFQTELGWAGDFWFGNRPKNWENFELNENIFSDQSTPNTRANLNQSRTHIVLENFSSNSQKEMSFDYRRDLMSIGYPLALGDGAAKVTYAIAGALHSKDKHFIYTLLDNGQIYATGESGLGLGYPNRRVIAEVNPGKLYQALAKEDIYLACISDKMVYGFDNSQTGNDSLALQTGNPIEVAAIPVTPPVLRDNTLYIACANDSLYILDISSMQITDRIFRSSVHTDLVINPESMVDQAAEEQAYVAISPLLPDQGRQQVEFDAKNNQFVISDFASRSIVNSFDPGIRENGQPLNPAGQFSLADIDGNGTNEIVFVQGQFLYVFNTAGNPLNNFPIKIVLAENDSLLGTPLIADFENDQKPEIIVSTQKGQILAFNFLGKPVDYFPLSTGEKLSSSAMLTRLDDDEYPELAVVTEGGKVYVWELPFQMDAENYLWPLAEYTAGNNAYIETELEFNPVTGGIMPLERAYNYPNPNQGNSTTIRYYLNGAADVSIKIYDTAGIPVDEFNGPGVANVDNEIVWDVASVASGVYLCHIQASSAGGSESKIIKIMVVH